MPKKILCWQALNCKESKCPLFEKKNYKCWLVSGTLCHNQKEGEPFTKLDTCLDCFVFNNNLTISSAKESFRVLSNQLKEYFRKNSEYEEKLKNLNKQLSNSVGEALTANEILHNIIEFLPDATFVIDKNKRVIEWNRAMEELTGIKKSEIIGKGDYIYAKAFYGNMRPILIDLLDGSNEEIEKNYINFERKANLVVGEVCLPFFRGRKDVYLWAIASPIYDKNGERIGAIESIREVTDYRNTEKMFIDVNEKLRLWAHELELRTKELNILVETSEQLQSCVDIEEAYSVIAQATQEFYPLSSGCLYVLGEDNILHLVHPWGKSINSEEAFEPSRCLALRSRSIFKSLSDAEYQRCEHLKDNFSGASLCIPLILKDEFVGILYLEVENDPSLLPFMEMTESKYLLMITLAKHVSLSINNLRLREKLQYQAIRDPLTGLFNRRYMEETFERELQRANRRKSTVSVLLFDIDHFKHFNDTYSHLAGDRMLKEIAAFVAANVRREDIVSRYGGEEFLIIMPDASLEVAKERAEFLRMGAKKLRVIHQDKLLGPVTLSFGISAYPYHGKEVETLIKTADRALYMAKAAGRDRVVVA
ncbi:MAG: diguanylate cyclase [Deltaproteobacteria bacterium]|nr:diguanylate cyclase [Deltaproteobacteria bacterium]